MATEQQILQLKADWLADPCWDIEDTEGFEEHREELTAWRDAYEIARAQEHQENVQRKARILQCPRELAAYLMDLEYRVQQLENRKGCSCGPNI